MNNEQKALVQHSFEIVLTIEEAAAALFYGRLFEIDPSLRSMFKGDITEQGEEIDGDAERGREQPRSD